MSLYTGYDGAKSCTGRAADGAKALMSWFLGAYSGRGARNLGIYNCRQIPGSTSLSLHGEGRAADLGVPVGAGWAQTLADALVANSGELGVQLVIYRRKVWSGRYPNSGWRAYTGSNPHNDHLHVELSWQAARTLTTQAIQARLVGTPVPNPGPSTDWTKAIVMSLPVLKRGAKSVAVTRLQALLNVAGQSLKLDGDFGSRTEAAVRAEQSQAGTVADGVVGKHTWSVLIAGRDLF